MFKTSTGTSLITTTLVCCILYGVFRGPQIACVDILTITNQFIKTEALKNLSQAEKQLAIKKFSHQLEEALTDLATSKNLILVPREAVLKGCSDYTHVLKDKMHLESNS